MKRWIVLSLIALIGCAGRAETSRHETPAALHVDGVPEIPNSIRDRLAPYEQARSAGFHDWSPDGSRLIVSSRAGDTSQLFAVSGPGEKLEQVTFFDEPVSGGAFLADGSIVFSSGRGGDENFQIYRLSADRKATMLTDGKSRHERGPLAHDKRRFTFASNRRNKRDMDQFLWNDGAVEPLFEVDRESWSVSDWSPDDSTLAIRRHVSVVESYPHLLDVKTRRRRPIPVPGGKASFGPIRFAPDGRSLLVACDAGHEFRTLARVDLDGFKFTWLTEDIPWDVDDIEVSPDRIAFTVNEDGMSRLYFLDPKTWKRTPVELPMGTAGGLKFDRERLALTLSRPEAPGDVYVLDGALKRWTFSDIGPLDPSKFVLPKRIQFPSFDGRTIPAYYFPAARPGRAPVIINIHGGPEGQTRPSFSALTQFWVQELGCAVIGPNVRGSTGYGKTYVSLDDGFKREDSVRDIGALLDWIGKQPELDPDRVAVMGGSYGGFMVLASLVMHGERLRAGVDVVGISNFISFLETTSAYRQDLRRVEYGDERDPAMREYLIRISPLNHADRIRSALLVAHGRNDPRVPFGEAEQIARRVRENGRPVWTVFADNEGHGFARKENRDYLNAASVLFFEKHLLGP